MSNVEEKPVNSNCPKISGALTYPEHQSIERNLTQPRQPHNLQGLLRFAMDATKVEDTAHLPESGLLDEQRRKFLEDALKSMTVDVIELLHKNVQILRTAHTLSVDSDPRGHLKAFEVILEHIDNIDTANDFHKIGGFMIFEPCLNSEHSCVRAGACDILAELCQNNPYCQRVVTENGMLQQVLHIVDQDPSDEARVKAVYAVSCNVRENEAGLAQFLQHEGVQSVLRAMQRPADKLRTKCAFLLATLGQRHAQVRDILVSCGAVNLLAGLLAEQRCPSHEHLLSLLRGLATENQQALTQCTDPALQLHAILRRHLNQVRDREECQEETQYCRELLELVFKSDLVDADR